MFSTFANPHRFMALSRWLMPVLAVLGGFMLITGWIWALGFVPDERYQGATVRIMYVHVPSASVSQIAYFSMAASSLLYLVLRHTLADIAAKSMAPIAAALTFICLVTGAIWGRPTWGTYWVWDARLTSMLFQLFLILGYMALRAAYQKDADAARTGGILCLVGALNLPIIRFSVDWWNSLHQPSSLLNSRAEAYEVCEKLSATPWLDVCREAVKTKSVEACAEIGNPEFIDVCQTAVAKGVGLAPEFLWPLFYNMAAVGFLFGAFTLIGMRTEIFKRQYEVGMARLNRSEA